MKKSKFWVYMLTLTTALLMTACGGDDGDDGGSGGSGGGGSKEVLLEVSPTNITLDENGKGSFAVMSNTSWTVSCSESWCSVSQTTGNGNVSSISVSATANSSSESRMAIITVKAGTQSCSISVTQNGKSSRYTVGHVFGKSGNIYESVAAAKAAGDSAVAMIAYVGTQSYCDNGLAIALSDFKNPYADAGSDDWEWYVFAWRQITSFIKYMPDVSFGYWRCPTRLDFQYMFVGCGAAGTPSEYDLRVTDCRNLNNNLTAAGGKALNEDYWTSEEWVSDRAYAVHITNGSASSSREKITYHYRLRFCLVF